MSNEKFINSISVISSVSHNENTKLNNFSKLQNNLRPYTAKVNKLPELDSKKPFLNTLTNTTKLSSRLSSLTSDSIILARIEASPYLRSALLSNPWLADEVINNPRLLTAIIKSPGFLTSLTNNSGLLSSIKDNPTLLSEIIQNPTLSIKSILERLTKKPEINSSPNIKNDSISHPLDKSIIASERVRPVIRTLLSRLNTVSVESLEVQKQQASQVLEVKILESRAPIKAPIIPILKTAAYSYFDARLFAINPSLLALLGAAAFTANRGKIIPASGSLKDVGVELETQTESQPDAIQKLDQVERIGDVEELPPVLRN